jgi:hypothetical protein
MFCTFCRRQVDFSTLWKYSVLHFMNYILCSVLVLPHKYLFLFVGKYGLQHFNTWQSLCAVFLLLREYCFLYLRQELGTVFPLLEKYCVRYSLCISVKPSPFVSLFAEPGSWRGK